MTEWIYNNELFQGNDIEDYEGFIYLITNTLTDRKYIGKKSFWSRRKLKKATRRKTFESDWRDYWSSSEELLTDVEKFGKENFVREILLFCRYKKAMSFNEEREQWERRVLETDEYYNTNIGGRFFVSETEKIYERPYKIVGKNDKWRKIKSEQMMGDNNPAKRPEVREKLSVMFTGEKNPRFGKTNSKEQTSAIVESTINTSFMNKDGKNKRVKKEELDLHEKDGWKFGRVNTKKLGAPKGVKRKTAQCPHCGKIAAVSQIKQHHLEKCKSIQTAT
jgi:hypothetical protein